MAKLSPKLILSFSYPQEGETLKWDHTECGDTRGRLYITRPMGQTHTLLGYCHNCSSGGVAIIKGADHPRNINCSITPLVKEPYVTPRGLEDLGTTPAFPYLQQYDLAHEAINYGMKYEPSTNRLYIPLYKADSDEPFMHQFRRLSTDSGTPKYITVKDPNYERGWADGMLWGSDADRVAIVEDVLSALACQTMGVCAYPLLGTHAPREVLHGLATNFIRVGIWLDNDAPEIIQKAEDMRKFIQLCGRDDCSIVKTSAIREPKHYMRTPSEFERYINDLFR